MTGKFGGGFTFIFFKPKTMLHLITAVSKVSWQKSVFVTDLLVDFICRPRILKSYMHAFTEEWNYHCQLPMYKKGHPNSVLDLWNQFRNILLPGSIRLLSQCFLSVSSCFWGTNDLIIPFSKQMMNGCLNNTRCCVKIILPLKHICTWALSA